MINVDAREQTGTTHQHVKQPLANIVITVFVAILSHGLAIAAAEYLWFRTSDLYGETMYIVRTSEILEQTIGAPIVSGWPLVSRSVYDGIGEVSARLPIRGSRGQATVHLRAKNGGGSWEYQQLEARVDRQPAIDLMPYPWRPQTLALRGSGQLYFAGVGELSLLDVSELAHYFGELYHINIRVLPALTYEARRDSAKQMIRVLKAGYPQVVADPQAVIIAVTEIDMDWFSWRDDNRFAVVSAAGLSRDQFRRQVAKNLGLLWFELPFSADSRSLLYTEVGGRIDLDLMSDQF